MLAEFDQNPIAGHGNLWGPIFMARASLAHRFVRASRRKRIDYRSGLPDLAEPRDLDSKESLRNSLLHEGTRIVF